MNKAIRYRIAIVGAGGTGSHFIARFSQFLNSFFNSNVLWDVIMVDGDHVEDNNLSRQIFLEEDLQQNKAETMALAVAESYGLNFLSYPHYLDSVDDLQSVFRNLRDSSYTNDKYITNINVCIGCCDNHRCRQIMEKWFEHQKNAIYIDAANEFSVGEVVTAIKIHEKIIAPPRSFYFPEVLEDKSKRRSEESCGVINQSAPQHITTNAEAANIILSIMAQLLTTNNITGGIVYFDTFKFTKVFRKYTGGVDK